MGATQSKAAVDGADGKPGVGIDRADYSEKLNELTFVKTDGSKLGPFMIKGLNGVSLDTAVMSGGELLFTKTDGTKLGPFKVKGADGLSIKNITYDELSGKITFVMTDDTKVGGFMVRGAQGPKGDTGKDGPKGETGLTGNTGAAGVSNVEGPKGDTGLTGLTGTGLASATFVNGQLSLATTDPTLKFGPFNVMGPQGPKGDTGAAGKDAGKTFPEGIEVSTYKGVRPVGGSDYLRIYGGTNGTALHGRTVVGEGGLLIGTTNADWNLPVTNGHIRATGDISAGGGITAGGKMSAKVLTVGEGINIVANNGDNFVRLLNDTLKADAYHGGFIANDIHAKNDVKTKYLYIDEKKVSVDHNGYLKI